MEKWLLALIIGTGAAILTMFVVLLILWPDSDEDESLVTVRT